MYGELVKSLRQCAEASCAGCKNDLVQLGCRGLLQHEAADAIEELIAKLNHADDQIDRLVEAAEERRWIPVEERLPQESDRYMVIAVEPWFGTVSAEIMKYRVNENLWVYDGRITEATVTHWMPLPKPPKEE